MLRKTMMMVGLLAFVGAFALAQYTVMPTGYDVDALPYGADAADKGVDTASVNQTVTLRVPKATALHLDVTELEFDITPLDGGLWPESYFDFAGEMVCVYGSSPSDVPLGDWVLPLGTLYAVGPEGYPQIEVINHGGLVTAYPPIQFDASGELVPGSKDHFVCYRTFILQKFSNGSLWDLTVERTDTGGAGTLQHIYIQDNPCDTFGAVTGFFALEPGGTAISLVPSGLASGTTGARSCGLKSWLDDLVVVAVKVNADYAGDNVATLQYTLATKGWW